MKDKQDDSGGNQMGQESRKRGSENTHLKDTGKQKVQQDLGSRRDTDQHQRSSGITQGTQDRNAGLVDKIKGDRAEIKIHVGQG